MQTTQIMQTLITVIPCGVFGCRQRPLALRGWGRWAGPRSPILQLLLYSTILYRAHESHRVEQLTALWGLYRPFEIAQTTITQATWPCVQAAQIMQNMITG